jgi:DNA repair protein RadA/Sms
MSLFSCASCKATAPAFVGRCPKCGEWDTYQELSFGRSKGTARVLLDSRDSIDDVARFTTGLPGVDAVLGGGLVRDSLVLLGGEPGVGKSTLVLEIIRGLLVHEPSVTVLYATAEESVSQVRGRAKRLAVSGGKRVYLLRETEIEGAMKEVKECGAKILIIDSIQTMTAPDHDSPAGEPSQMKAVAHALMKFAKEHQIACLIIGHVTKDGELAGPKQVEHLVDVVLSFDGLPGSSLRRLSCPTKNRFGSTQARAHFEMNEQGLREVSESGEA